MTGLVVPYRVNALVSGNYGKQYKYTVLWSVNHSTMPRLPTSALSAKAPNCYPTSTRFLPVVDVNGTLYYSSPLPMPVHLSGSALASSSLPPPVAFLSNKK